ncbi:hypothetical protein BH20ACT6_BH20ACT6_08100 [soil metagenome]
MRASTNQGPGRVLVAIYGVFAVSATARSAVQLAADFERAPVAYSLSALAALVYVLATFALARGSGAARQVAWAAVGIELVGVLAVGTLSILDPALFPDETVWSGYGAGYGYVPLVLPVVGLGWLWHTRSRGGGTAGSAGASHRPEGTSPPSHDG